MTDDPFEDDLSDLPDDAKKITEARKYAPGPVSPVVSSQRLQEPSPKPYHGRPDPKYPELDSLDYLYIPRFLVREWGIEKFERSAYLALWKSEASRRERLEWGDPKPGGKK